MNLYEIVAYVGIVFLAILIFGIFLILRSQMAAKSADAATPMTLGVLNGNIALQSYLRTRLDEDAATYGHDAPPGEGTMADGLAAAMADATCRDWLIANGKYGGKDPFALTPPAGACRAFFQRTVLFFRSVCGDDYFLQLTTAGQQVRIGEGVGRVVKSSFLGLSPDFVITNIQNRFLSLSDERLLARPPTQSDFKDPHTSIIGGVQAVPGTEPVLVQLVCAERYGVNP